MTGPLATRERNDRLARDIRDGPQQRHRAGQRDQPGQPGRFLVDIVTVRIMKVLAD
jgi:hypothetical protein